MKRKRHDEATKLLFVAGVVEDMVRVIEPDIASALDFGEMAPLPTEYISADRTKRIGDAVYKVPFVGDPEAYVLTMAEFQSRDDPAMGSRAREYVVRMLDDYRRRGIVGEDEDPDVLPFVVYIRASPWRRSGSGTGRRVWLPRAAAQRLASLRERAYIPVDMTGGPRPEWPDKNRLAAVARLTSGPPLRTAQQLGVELARYTGPEYAGLRLGMHAWTEEVLGPDLELPPFEELEDAREGTMGYLLQEKVEAWADIHRAEGWSDGRREGRQEGVAAGQRELLEGMARQRFGAAAARRLSEAVDGAAGARLIGDAALLIVSCGTEAEFAAGLDRLRRG